MGPALSKAIKSIDGGSDAEKEIKDALEALFELGKSRNDAVFAKVTSDVNKVYAPVDKVLLQRQSIVASASNNTEDIVSGTKDAVGSLIKGQILDGVTNIIGNALNIVLGSSAGRVSQSYTYALVATDLGALMRIDVDIYSFEITSQGLQTHAKNMTAITSVVSSVKPQGITLGDIRAIVSLSYGSSPLDVQQTIFDLVKAAWENDRRGIAGTVLSPADVKGVQGLFVPSKYEERIKQQRGLRSAVFDPSTRLKFGRQDFIEAVRVPRSRLGIIPSEDGSQSQNRFGPMSLKGSSEIGKPIDVSLWVQLSPSASVNDQWFRFMEGALKGFEEPERLKYVKISGGRSGSVLCFQFQIFDTVFDASLKYFDDTIIPSINSAGYLSYVIAHMGLQYTSPLEDGSQFFTKVAPKQNRVTNKTKDIVTFYSPSHTVLLMLEPNKADNLNGPVMYVTGSKLTQQSDQPLLENDTAGDGGQKDPAPTPVPPPTRWATYQKVMSGSIITGAAATLVEGIEGGYIVQMHMIDDVTLSISYAKTFTEDS